MLAGCTGGGTDGPSRVLGVRDIDLIAIQHSGDDFGLVGHREDGWTIPLPGPRRVGAKAFPHVDADGAVVLLDDDGTMIRVAQDGTEQVLNDDEWFCPHHVDDHEFYAARRRGGTWSVGRFRRDGTEVQVYPTAGATSSCVLPMGDHLAWWGKFEDGDQIDVWVTDLDGGSPVVVAGREDCSEIVSDTFDSLLVYSRACADPDDSATIVVDVASGQETRVGPNSGGARFSPDGRRVAMTVPTADDGADVQVVGVDGSGGTIAIPDAQWPAWVPLGGQQ